MDNLNTKYHHTKNKYKYIFDDFIEKKKKNYETCIKYRKSNGKNV